MGLTLIVCGEGDRGTDVFRNRPVRITAGNDRSWSHWYPDHDLLIIANGGTDVSQGGRDGGLKRGKDVQRCWD